ncbi:uracil-DNA glycosylase [Ammoniphilus sp. CFH 90114]|nr:uracil-DNA glycosylase [Ammoniphilus sp. CFH 90114]RXT13516.1 uracil-DNA glycosylase [Ammoniphilus sp. CFH 90114]
MEKQQRINCVKCKHYYVTWDKHNPRGCKFFEFKTSLLPSLVVFQSSGQPCLKLEPK